MSININCSNNKLHITLHSYSMSPSGKKTKKKQKKKKKKKNNVTYKLT